MTEREIANQEIQTFRRQKESQDQRITMEHARGTADMQAQLAKSSVGVEIEKNNANARKAEAEGESVYIRETGAARGAEVEAIGLARAKAYESQVKALGQGSTALVNVVNALSESKVRFVPEVLVSGADGMGSLNALAGVLTQFVHQQNGKPSDTEQ